MPFGLYKAAARIGLPDLGISERTTGYTTRQTTPAVTPLSYTPAFITPLPRQTTLSPAEQAKFYASYSKNNPASSGYVPPATKTVTTTKQTGKVSGANTNAYANNPDYLGRFEELGGVNDPKRIAAYEKYLSTKGVSKSSALSTEEQQRQAQQGLIDNFYNENLDYLGSLENALRGNEQQYYDIAGSPYDAQVPLLQSARDAAMQRNQGLVQETNQMREDALSQARRLFNEMSIATRQQYGGTSSTGEFAQALQGRELQRNQSGIQQTAQNNLAKLYQNATETESQYQSQLQSLEQQKQAAIAQARLSFQERLQDLKNKRMELGANKQNMELDLLREFYANRQAIEQQATQYAQQLQATAAQARLNLQSAVAQYQANTEKPIDVSAIPQAQYSAIDQQVYGGAPQIAQGYFKRPYEPQFA